MNRAKQATACALALAGVVLLAASVSTPAGAQTYPARAVRMVAPFPAGGGTDLSVRRLADRLSKL